MTTTPTGDLALTLQNLEILIATSATFQAAVGATGDAAAKLATARASVYWPGTNMENSDGTLAVERPFAWLRLDGEQTWDGANGGPGGFVPDLNISVMLERDDDPADSVKERQVKAMNYFDAVRSEMCALAKSGGYLEMTRITLGELLMSDPNEKGVLYTSCMLKVKVW